MLLSNWKVCWCKRLICVGGRIFDNLLILLFIDYAPAPIGFDWHTSPILPDPAFHATARPAKSSNYSEL